MNEFYIVYHIYSLSRNWCNVHNEMVLAEYKTTHAVFDLHC